MTEEEAKYETDLTKWEDRHPETPIVKLDNSPSALISIALSQGTDLDKLERLLALQIKWEENEAKKAYVKAMAAFKAHPPAILKTAHVSYVNSKNQEVKWDHAVLGEITEAITNSMSAYGFYHRWEMEQPDVKTVKTTCIITHEMGHSEKVSMQGPPDISGGKDELKAVSSTNTFLQRLTLLAVTGLAAKGLDRESPSEEIQYLSQDQQTEITDLMLATDANEKKFLEYLGAESLEKIPASQYGKALAALKAKKEKKADAKA